MNRHVLGIVLGLALLASQGQSRAAETAAMPFLHPLFRDHAVLQRGLRVPVWGWTQPGALVTVSLNGKTASATANDSGRWEARIGPFAAGGPYTLTVSGLETVTIKDVLIGDVWICSGQSNMEMGIGACNVPNDIATANFPQIRLLTVPKLVAAEPVKTLACRWLPCSPQNVMRGTWGGFSAAGYYFGRDLHQQLKVPIGLIHTSWGGTVAEAWVSREGLQPLADFKDRLTQFQEVVAAAKLGKTDPARQPPQRLDAGNPNVTTVLFNGMIAPLVPYAIKGAIWYQGESNVGRARQYRDLLPAMIQDWRRRFQVGDFPFYIVQLAAFMPTSPEPRDNDWAELREAQTLTAKNLNHCGLAVAIDIGDAADIHPKNKKDVGRRLALSAAAQTYGMNVEYSGPWYKSMKITRAGIRLKFDHVGGRLVARGGQLKGFAIAGEDQKFVWADAVIAGKTVLVSSPKVAKPVAVRYAWDINPVCNLFNEAGLPAVPFRTDDWPMVTRNNK